MCDATRGKIIIIIIIMLVIQKAPLKVIGNRYRIFCGVK